jgi:peptide/nickel transport system substrate-binding protein
MFRRIVLGLTAGLMVLAASGCSSSEDPSDSSSSGGEPVAGGELAIGLDSEPESLDPAADSGYASTQVKAQIFDALFLAGEDGSIEPNLVDSWEESSPTEYVFTLRSGVTFTDGTPFNAEAVKTNLERIADPKGGSTWQDALSAVKNIDVVDSETVKLTLSEPYAPLLSVLADQPGYMVSPKTLQSPDSVATEPVGTGPFELAEWQKNDHIELVKNDDYWRDGEPHLDRVTFRPISDPTAKITDLLSGRIQAVDYVPAQLISRVQSEDSLQYKAGEPNYGATVYIPLNPNKAPFDDVEVRQAVQVAIDRESIVKNVAFGAGTPSRAMLGSSSWAFDDSLPELTYDVEQAKSLLGGQQIDIELQVPPTYVQHAQVIKENLAAAGINAELVRMDWGQLIDNYYKGDFQAQVQDVLGLTRSDPDGLLSGFFETSGSLNGTGAGSAEIDEMLDEARTIQDREKRKEIYADVLEQEAEQSFYVPIYNPANDRAWSTGVHGMEPPANGLMVLRQAWRER